MLSPQYGVVMNEYRYGINTDVTAPHVFQEIMNYAYAGCQVHFFSLHLPSQIQDTF